MTILQFLEIRLREAVRACGFAGDDLARVSVTQAADLRFGDYQSNVAMVLAKAAKRNPRELAGEIMGRTEVEGMAGIEIAGPGFLNFRVAPAAFADRVGALLEDDRLGVPLAAEPRTVVVDFSAPNIAKPMHVGHIRSTIIGDALSRLARFLGHRVITDNHVGDWGTQFGMVIWAWKREEGGVDRKALDSDPLAELLRLYRLANGASKEDEAVREECREELVKLQQGDPGNLEIWEECVRLSRNGLQRIYGRLNVHFDHWLGESCYNERLEGVVEGLLASGLARQSEGAICVFSDGEGPEERDPFRICRDGGWQDNPMIVRKRDGGFNYSTSDIATIDHRLEEFEAEAVWYVVDHRQSLHFRQLFALSARRGLSADFAHVSFGTILGKDGKPLKTRAGDLPQLEDLLDDAVSEARRSAEERSRLETAAEKDALAELIGISAVKFTELSHHRTSDYIFDLEKMVAMEGDTAPYLQYSYVRCRSIFRKLGEEVRLDREGLVLAASEEIHLARMLARYGEAVPTVLDGFRPNLLANYLLELARAYHSFFQACPVLKAEGASRKTRLVLCELTARILQQGLGLLGIEVPERM
jgi:arginyl-tRNA synthetase